MNRPQLAIIGNGMATCRLLDELSRRGGLGPFRVAVFGEEPHGGYNRILLNKVLDGGSVDDITLKPASWYAEKGVQFLPGRRGHSALARRAATVDGRRPRTQIGRAHV